MASYAIGDIHGCYDALRRLLEQIHFSPDKDTLYFVGDLVNRGPQSLEVLNFIYSLKHAAQLVLGNHDITLLAAHYHAIPPKKSFKPFLNAPERETLAHWLQQQSFMHTLPELGYIICHAGIYPKWSFDQAQKYAREASDKLQQEHPKEWLTALYDNKPTVWQESLADIQRDRFIVNAFTRMRYVHHETAALDFSHPEPPRAIKQHPYWIPWYTYPHRQALPYRVVFGHWSSLGYYYNHNVTAIDSGCVWGGQLTALKLDQNTHTAIAVHS